jgi:hypothetical protein
MILQIVLMVQKKLQFLLASKLQAKIQFAIQFWWRKYFSPPKLQKHEIALQFWRPIFLALQVGGQKILTV